MLTDRIAEALKLAVAAHATQVRKGTDIPYVAHPLGVASLALDFGATEDQAIAALLHDVLEDGGPEYAPIIREQFGEAVLAIVEGCTDGVPGADGKKEAWDVRKRRYLEHLDKAPDEVLLVSGADKLHNARAIVSDLILDGDAVFGRFTTGKEGTLWYYGCLSEIFTRRNSPMARPLAVAVAEMQRLAQGECDAASAEER